MMGRRYIEIVDVNLYDDDSPRSARAMTRLPFEIGRGDK